MGKETEFLVSDEFYRCEKSIILEFAFGWKYSLGTV